MLRCSQHLLATALVLGCGGAGAGTGTASAEEPAPASEPPSAPEPAPAILGADGDIALATLAGEPTLLREHGAPVTVIALWATWCAPCLEELPLVEDLYQAFRDDPQVSVLAVNVDEPDLRDRALEVVSSLALTMPVLLDGQPLMERVVEGKFIGLPLLVVIDRSFQIHRRTGFEVGITRERYLAEKRFLIAAALRGESPDAVVLPEEPGR
jgi:thiol-disulfide isomerase/thioredoxin